MVIKAPSHSIPACAGVHVPLCQDPTGDVLHGCSSFREVLGTCRSTGKCILFFSHGNHQFLLSMNGCLSSIDIFNGEITDYKKKKKAELPCI